MPDVTIIRKIPVELALFEFEVDGKRQWAVIYAAVVDGEDISAAAVTFMGASDTPKGAVDLAAHRIGPLGF